MPSMKNIALGAAALIGMASAFPQAAPYSNGTSTNTTTGAGSSSTGISVPTNNTSNNSAFCPTLSGQVYVDGLEVAYLVQCDTTHFGTIIEIDANITLAKRQAAVAPTSLGDCLTICSANTICVGAAFNSALQTCTLYSDVGAAFTSTGVSFGVVVARDVNTAAPAGTSTAPAGTSTAAAGGVTTIPAGGVATSTIYSTNVVTISSCAPTVTNCPLNTAGAYVGPVVVTQIIPVSTTTYICPSATVVPATPVACGCAYGATTVGAYAKTVISGSTTIQQITSTVIAVPSGSVTTMATTVCNSCVLTASASTTTYAAITTQGGNVVTASTGLKASATTSMAVFQGAASQMKAGAGLGAVVAAAALLL